jgi:two-component system chemotaxis response regulator CheV
LTAFTRINDKIVEILDVERVLADIIPPKTIVSDDIRDESLKALIGDDRIEILAVDDSITARNQIRDALDSLDLNIDVTNASDGLKGLELLKKMAADGTDVSKHFTMLITDAEMPEMDGYRLTSEIRSDERLKDLFVVMHTSLSGSFNETMTKKVGCDGFLSKFRPDELAILVQDRIRDLYTK